MTADRCVILFVKFPEKGKVKSRLSRDMDWDFVLRLYECMVEDTIEVLKRARAPFVICFDPPGALDLMRSWLGPEFSFSPQTGNDLGARMEQAFVQAFSGGADRALLIGSDIPGLRSEVIAEAFESLASHDAVIGPARDGGYYLIGFQKKGFEASIFHDMMWSTPSVCSETMVRLRGRNRTVHVLPRCSDVDTKEDLKTFLKQAEKEEAADSRTLEFLKAERNRIIG